MDDARERRCLVALHLVPGLGPRLIARLVRTLGSAAAAWGAPEPVLAGVRGIGSRRAALIVRERPGVDVDRELRRAGAAGARVVTWLDAEYPAALRDLQDAPPVVYLRGPWSGAAAPAAVAIVGTRRASPYGLGIAEALGAVLGRAGLVVISGLARGIDRAAHTGALRAGGVTVGVLGCGVDVAYPPEHRSLMEAMRQRGAVVAELPMGTRPRARQFPMRNRLISGLSRAVVVVEGDVDSGAVITARYARAQARPVFAVPGSVYASGSRGPHRLLAEGARLLDAPGRLAEALGVPEDALRARLAGAPASAAAIGDAETRVLALLDDQPRHIDAIAARSGLGAARAAAALAALEVRGLARQCPGKNFVRRPGRNPGEAARSTAGGEMWPDHSSS
jgi:DNA processing protein